MATYQKRNGRITVTVRIKPHPAKSETFDTKREAKAWADSLELKLRNEKKGKFNHIIFKDAFIEYRDVVSAKKKGAKREYTRINYLIDHMNSELPLSEVDKALLIEWREYRLETVSGSTARRELQVLGAFFTWCINTKMYLSESPMKGVVLPSANPHREKVITDEEIEILLPFLKDELKSIFFLALETGMRLSEICGLEWDRVRLDQNFVYLKDTKNGRAREVPCTVAACEIIRQRKGYDDKKVFSYNAKDASHEFMRARIKAGLYGFTFHDTRHTAATRIAQKIPLLDLCKMFGWVDPKRAMIYYNPTSSEIAARLSRP
ncbi:TPA: tyrosine-type recombinase/integrase [Acinetobacter baumannii]